MKQNVKKISNLSLTAGIISIVLDIWIPWMGLISIAAFSLCYVLNLVQELSANRRLDPISVILCIGVVVWLIAHQSITSEYVGLAGQCIIYMYLIRTGKQTLGKVDKGFVVFIAVAVLIGLMKILVPSKWTDILNIIFQVIVLLRFIDPILSRIALKHREKRLANEGVNN